MEWSLVLAATHWRSGVRGSVNGEGRGMHKGDLLECEGTWRSVDPTTIHQCPPGGEERRGEERRGEERVRCAGNEKNMSSTGVFRL